MDLGAARRKRVLSAILVACLIVIVAATLFSFSASGSRIGIQPAADPTVRAGQATKEAEDRAWEQLSQDARAGKLGTPPPKDVQSAAAHQHLPMPIATMEAQTVPNTGPIQIPQSLPSGWGGKYHVTTMWTGTLKANGQKVTVYAGSKADGGGAGGAKSWGPIEQGAVIIDDRGAAPIEGKGRLGGTYLSPTRTGMLTIVSADSSCLGLQSSDGTRYAFDVATQQWACSTAP
jgi:hypothetical protein